MLIVKEHWCFCLLSCVLYMGIGLHVDRCWNVRCKYRCATHHFSLPRVWSSNACTFSVVKGYKLVLPRAQRPIHWNTRFHLKHVGYGAIPKSKLTIFYTIATTSGCISWYITFHVDRKEMGVHDNDDAAPLDNVSPWCFMYVRDTFFSCSKMMMSGKGLEL